MLGGCSGESPACAATGWPSCLTRRRSDVCGGSCGTARRFLASVWQVPRRGADLLVWPACCIDRSADRLGFRATRTYGHGSRCGPVADLPVPRLDRLPCAQMNVVPPYWGGEVGVVADTFANSIEPARVREGTGSGGNAHSKAETVGAQGKRVDWRPNKLAIPPKRSTRCDHVSLCRVGRSLGSFVCELCGAVGRRCCVFQEDGLSPRMFRRVCWWAGTPSVVLLFLPKRGLDWSVARSLSAAEYRLLPHCGTAKDGPAPTPRAILPDAGCVVGQRDGVELALLDVSCCSRGTYRGVCSGLVVCSVRRVRRRHRAQSRVLPRAPACSCVPVFASRTTLPSTTGWPQHSGEYAAGCNCGWHCRVGGLAVLVG